MYDISPNLEFYGGYLEYFNRFCPACLGDATFVLKEISTIDFVFIKNYFYIYTIVTCN